MTPYRLSLPARTDIVNALLWSAEHFGFDARDRYQALIRAAIEDVASEADRPGSKLRPELGDDVRTWHLRLSRDRTGAAPVMRPRHFLIYRPGDSLVVIGRLLHDAMDLERHVDFNAAWRP